MENKKYQSNANELIKIFKKLGFLNYSNVESALRSIPRHEFIPPSELDSAYCNEPLPIMKKQTVSQSGVVSRMTEWLDVKDGQNILEIGTGSGWQTAILSYLVGKGAVYSVEIYPELVKFARENLERMKIDNAHVVLGDGGIGYFKEAPYDRIIVTAACHKIPSPLFDQLDENGLILAPVGTHSQSLVLFKKVLGSIVKVKNQSNYLFVPLLGKFGANRI